MIRWKRIPDTGIRISLRKVLNNPPIKYNFHPFSLFLAGAILLPYYIVNDLAMYDVFQKRLPMDAHVLPADGAVKTNWQHRSVSADQIGRAHV